MRVALVYLKQTLQSGFSFCIQDSPCLAVDAVVKITSRALPFCCTERGSPLQLAGIALRYAPTKEKKKSCFLEIRHSPGILQLQGPFIKSSQVLALLVQQLLCRADDLRASCFAYNVK